MVISRNYPLLKLVLGFLLVACGLAGAQSKVLSGYIPPAEPGFDLYYQHLDARLMFVARWGYHDGWLDGRHDRNHALDNSAQNHDSFVTPPEHGEHPGVDRQEYVKLYRQAYLRGFQHGSRI